MIKRLFNLLKTHPLQAALDTALDLLLRRELLAKTDRSTGQPNPQNPHKGDRYRFQVELIRRWFEPG